MKKLPILLCLIFLFISFSSFSQTDCGTNAGFETGTTSGWVCKSGSYGSSIYSGYCPVVSTGVCPSFPTDVSTTGSLNTNGNDALGTTGVDRHTIMTKNYRPWAGVAMGMDSISGNKVPVVNPNGGNYSFRLGDEFAGGVGINPSRLARAEAIRLTFNVSANASAFFFSHALFLQDPGHLPEEQPRFEVYFTLPDLGDKLIPGEYYKYVAGNSNQYCSGTRDSSTFKFGVGQWRYTDWTDGWMDLSDYVGQNVAVEFRTSDCFPQQSVVYSVAGVTTSCSNGTCCWSLPVAGCTTISSCTNAPGTHSAYAYLDAYCIPTPNYIKGTCFYDYNSNGVKDAGEPPYPNLLIASSSYSGTNLYQTDVQGLFRNIIKDTGTVVTSPQIFRKYYTSTPLQHVSHFPSFQYVDSVNFGLFPIPGIQDLQITMIPLNQLRLGVDVVYRLQYTNVGTDTMSGVINMRKDNRTVYKSSAPGFASTNGDSASWNYSNLLPNESRTINVTLSVLMPPTANIGDLLSFSCVIEPVASDSVPNDNYAGLGEQRIVGSYDPNDKTVLGGDTFSVAQVKNGEYLTYLIRFQNTGNDTAFKIIVKDVLDTMLDASTFEMISSSHPYNLKIENSRAITWTYNNVLLPDSNVNEAESHGYICYRIKPKSTVKAGDVIRNSAFIYFDSNLPVVAVSSTTIALTTEVASIPHISDFHLYPNPTTGTVTLSYHSNKPGDTRIEIISLIGQVMRTEQVTSRSSGKQEVILDTQKLSSGIYFIRLGLDGKEAMMKMVKMD